MEKETTIDKEYLFEKTIKLQEAEIERKNEEMKKLREELEIAKKYIKMLEEKSSDNIIISSNIKKEDEETLQTKEKIIEKSESEAISDTGVEEIKSEIEDPLYYENIKKKAVEKGVEIKFIGSHISHSRGKINGEKIYSLWDSYVYADIVTYPSLWEGWGNQFIEAVFAKLPIIVFEYPVYISDLKKVGFDIISLGDKVKAYDELGLAVLPENIISEAVQKIISVLQDKEQYKKIVDKNYKLAENNFSLEELEKIVRRIMQELNN